MNKLSSIFQSPGRAEGPAMAEEKTPPVKEPAALPVESSLVPAAASGDAPLSKMDENMNFSRAKGLLSQAANSAANGFIGLLKNQATPADVLRNTLEEVIEYRAAEAALTRAAEESALRSIITDAPPTKNLVRLS